MADWTKDSREYLDGYLKQVSALVQEQEGDAEEIVENLREHVTNELASADDSPVTMDRLTGVLDDLGSPEQVVSLDGPVLSPTTLTAARRDESQSHARSNRRQSTALRVAGACVLVVAAICFSYLVIPNLIPQTVPSGEDLTVESYQMVIGDDETIRYEKVEDE